MRTSIWNLNFARSFSEAKLYFRIHFGRIFNGFRRTEGIASNFKKSNTKIVNNTKTKLNLQLLKSWASRQTRTNKRQKGHWSRVNTYNIFVKTHWSKPFKVNYDYESFLLYRLEESKLSFFLPHLGRRFGEFVNRRTNSRPMEKSLGNFF